MIFFLEKVAYKRRILGAIKQCIGISEATKINEPVRFVILYYISLKSLTCWVCIAIHFYCVFRLI